MFARIFSVFLMLNIFQAMNKLLYHPSKGVTIPRESPTVPNQSLTIREVLERYAVGRDVPFIEGGKYDDSENYIDHGISDLDITEQEEILTTEFELAKLAHAKGRGKATDEASERSEAKREKADTESDSGSPLRDEPQQGDNSPQVKDE